jgi:hypothetical protein
MRDVPSVISQSVRDVLAAHALSFSSDPNLLREIGNNATQALVSIDENAANYEIESMESTWRPSDGVWP